MDILPNTKSFIIRIQNPSLFDKVINLKDFETSKVEVKTEIIT